MIVRFRIRRDTAANWTASNPVLGLGEPGLETDTRQVKYGDGATAWNALAYSGGALTPALTAIGALTPAADRLPYFTGTSTAALATFTAFARTLVEAVTAAAARTVLGLGALATKATINDADWSGADLDIANGGTGASTAAAARTNLGLGTLATQSGTFSGTSSGTNTGDQTSVTGNAGTATALATGRTIAATGDITWTSPAFNGTANVTATATIGANVVTLAKMAQVATATLLGRTTAGTGNVEALTATQGRTVLGLATTDSPAFATVTSGSPFRQVGAAVTIAAADRGGTILSTAGNVTIPTDSVAIEIGSRVRVMQWGGGPISIARTAGVALYWYNGTTPAEANRTLAVGGWIDLVKVGANAWAAVGGQGVS